MVCSFGYVIAFHREVSVFVLITDCCIVSDDEVTKHFPLHSDII